MNIIGILGEAGSGKDTAAEILVRDHGFVKVALADPLKRICKEVFDFTDDQLWGPSESRNAEDKRYLRMPAGNLGRTIMTWNSEETYDTIPSPPEDIFLTPRHALQQLGTEWGRSCHADVWVKYALKVTTKLLSPPPSGMIGPWVPRYSAQTGFTGYSAEQDFVPGVQPAVKRPLGVVISDCRFKNEVDAINAAGGRIVKLIGRGGLFGETATHFSERGQRDIPDESFAAVIDNSGTLEALRTTLERLVAPK
jgi:hypothetical protein